MTLILGIDPGLVRTGWGVVKSTGNQLSLVAAGVIKTQAEKKDATKGHSSLLDARLLHISTELARVIDLYKPNEAAIEETFVNVNGQSTLKLGQARGAILLTLAQARLPTHEYAATLVKKSVTGAGRAEKTQVSRMVQILLPGCEKYGADAMDALAIAITHAHHRKLLVTGY